jgi:riboflavin kinase/FMN adenylyltransferase
MRLIRLTSEYIARIVAGEDRLPAGTLESCALAIGSFDGLHRGHQQLMQAVVDARHRRRLSASVVFTFRRHPRLVLARRAEPFLLTTWREKLAQLAKTPIEVVVAADFCAALAGLPYDDFVRRFLVEFLNMRHLVAGYDIHLGKDRQGNVETLQALGGQLGYTLEIMPALTTDGQTISSSAIRRHLALGNLEGAREMLGRPYALWGEVVPGENRGRKLGFPTANIIPLFEYKLLPAPGVYAVRVQIPGDAARASCRHGVLERVVETLPETDRSGAILSTAPSEWAVFGAMLNYGTVPTFHADGLAVPRVEAHLFDFDGDLRGRTVKVEWIRRLRAEKKFAGVEELVAQLRRDEQEARQIVGPC